jgi:hypothetical protein
MQISKRNERQPKAQARVVKEGVVVEKPAAGVIITTKMDGPAGGKSPNFFRLLVRLILIFWTACICRMRLYLRLQLP